MADFTDDSVLVGTKIQGLYITRFVFIKFVCNLLIVILGVLIDPKVYAQKTKKKLNMPKKNLKFFSLNLRKSELYSQGDLYIKQN